MVRKMMIRKDVTNILSLYKKSVYHPFPGYPLNDTVVVFVDLRRAALYH